MAEEFRADACDDHARERSICPPQRSRHRDDPITRRLSTNRHSQKEPASRRLAMMDEIGTAGEIETGLAVSAAVDSAAALVEEGDRPQERLAQQELPKLGADGLSAGAPGAYRSGKPRLGDLQRLLGVLDRARRLIRGKLREGDQPLLGERDGIDPLLQGEADQQARHGEINKQEGNEATLEFRAPERGGCQFPKACVHGGPGGPPSAGSRSKALPPVRHCGLQTWCIPSVIQPPACHALGWKTGVRQRRPSAESAGATASRRSGNRGRRRPARSRRRS